MDQKSSRQNGEQKSFAKHRNTSFARGLVFQQFSVCFVATRVCRDPVHAAFHRRLEPGAAVLKGSGST
jgi:hypothetical protein